MKSKPAVLKREREKAKRERRMQKAARRAAAAERRAAEPAGPRGEDRDLAGIRPGPQPPLE